MCPGTLELKMNRHAVAFLTAVSFFCQSALNLMAQQPSALTSRRPGVISTNILALVTNPVVQAELKLSEGQKAKLKDLSDHDEEQRQRWFERMGIARAKTAERRPDRTSGRSGDQLSKSERPVRARRGPTVRASADMDFEGNLVGATGGRNPDLPIDTDQTDPVATMLESRREIQVLSERSIARILSKAQYARVRQIQLQLAGPAALLQSEMVERLALDEGQVASIRELIRERHGALRATLDTRNALRHAAVDRDPAVTRFHMLAAQSSLVLEEAPNNQRNRAEEANRIRNNPTYLEARSEALRRFDKDPQALKQMAALRAQDEKIEMTFNAALHSKVLTRKQSDVYKRMLGSPFNSPAVQRRQS